MRKNYVKLPLLIAALYFGSDLHAQTTQDTVTKENKIEEVVVIGYGTQKKVDLTSAITTVKAADIVKTPSGQATQALQGKIITNGSPGEAPKINIRGVHSINGTNQPLYVVDGLFVDNIEFLNPNDIQDFTILKDASASAIYGVLAANGVVVITTKGGSYNKKPKLTYDSYYGAQYANNVIKMANAEQYTNFALESGNQWEITAIESAIERYGRSKTNPNLPNVNTDWYKEALRVAPIQSHSLAVDGGSEKVAYSLGGNYFSQDGILKMRNSYERFNIRAKVDAKATNWLNVGATINYTRGEKYDDEGSAWQQIYYAVPVMPVYDPLFTNADYKPYADAQLLGYRGHDNPFSLMDNVDKLGIQRSLNFNAYAEISILPKELTFKTTLSYNNRNIDERLMELPYFVNDIGQGFQRTINQSSITRNNANYEDYIWDNTLTWTKTLGDHDFTLMGGTSYADQSYKFLSVKGFFSSEIPGFSRYNEGTWYLNNTSDVGRISTEGSPYRYYRTSYFGRLSYKFKNRYIAYATLRNEGSNKFPNQKTINLPAFGLGWVASEESFLKDVSWLNLLKFRAGWGRLANDAVNASRPSTAFTVNSVFADTYLPAFQFTTYLDDVRREYTEETNVGLSAELLDRRLTLEGDYFVKDTKKMVIPVQPTIGNADSFKNVGAMRNKGFEISAGWRDKIGEDWRYSINGNFSQIKNEVTDLYGQGFIARGSGDFPQRLVVGQPIDVFYGYDVIGVYQNQAEINADPTAVAYNATNTASPIKPGYFKYRDMNGDGKIDAEDRMYLGSPVPTYYFGGSLAVSYKNWDFSMAFYGQGGNKILNRNRGEVIRTTGRNIDADFAINRWHGEGTTNEYISSEGYRNSWNNQKLSKFWLQDGDFFRVQNIQLGYTLKANGVPEMRFSVTADRPFMWTKSENLMNPEVANDGVNLDVYPTPSVVTFGYSIKF
ncbi:SusC/RagA family TonB-linked outer membrane protein [Epilithonimonas hungarica]|uniref:TonB-linked outer membrane protein, SusC/RagA family n=1 Tax=Epilithonimonas hungarica TaxID=454006 RepID=A0A1G7N9B7_9FLAO|nr:SusC/RagA family TonB-linked outer membrane protein [Epilithonimonas hungarica]SDF70497.1 TonB-linked outer membrane protein, SusC/RagA family [Epilithonimonas hungarica]